MKDGGVITSNADNNLVNNVHIPLLAYAQTAPHCMIFLPIKPIATTAIGHYLLDSISLVAYSLINSMSR